MIFVTSLIHAFAIVIVVPGLYYYTAIPLPAAMAAMYTVFALATALFPYSRAIYLARKERPGVGPAKYLAVSFTPLAAVLADYLLYRYAADFPFVPFPATYLALYILGHDWFRSLYAQEGDPRPEIRGNAVLLLLLAIVLATAVLVFFARERVLSPWR